MQAAFCKLIQLKLRVDLLTLFADPVFEVSVFKIRRFAQLVAGSRFLFTAVYAYNNGFDPPTASDKV